LGQGIAGLYGSLKILLERKKDFPSFRKRNWCASLSLCLRGSVEYLWLKYLLLIKVDYPASKYLKQNTVFFLRCLSTVLLAEILSCVYYAFEMVPGG
jgi:hypothetical protein